MKNIKIITCMIAFLPSVAIAEKYATIINIKPNYSNITNYINEKFCINKERPIYDRSYYEHTNGGDILTGMIIGGLLGKAQLEKTKELPQVLYWEELSREAPEKLNHV